MNVDYVEIKEYLKNKEENIYLRTFVYSVIISVLLILVIVFSSYKKKDLYYEDVLYLKDGMIVLMINYENLEYITSNKQLIINNKKYNYLIKEIDISESNNLYYEVKMVINMNDFKYQNVYYQYKILLKEESILKYIVRVLKGE